MVEIDLPASGLPGSAESGSVHLEVLNERQRRRWTEGLVVQRW